MKILFCFVASCLPISLCSQTPAFEFETEKAAAQVIVSDVASFWSAYDLFWQDTTQNPFVQYLEQGSIGLQDFIPNRIISAKALKLKLCLREGAADFISELLGYKEVKYLNGNTYAYGDLHEKELWAKFKREKESLTYDDWLYNYGQTTDRPSDLGYWMGYKICAAYYDQAPEKTKAIKDILQIEDCEAFLLASGYRR